MDMWDMRDSSIVLEETNSSDELIRAQYIHYQAIHFWKQVLLTYKQQARPSFMDGATTQLLHIPSSRFLHLARRYCSSRTYFAVDLRVSFTESKLREL